jgi:uncharacterized membrane protein
LLYLPDLSFQISALTIMLNVWLLGKLKAAILLNAVSFNGSTLLARGV